MGGSGARGLRARQAKGATTQACESRSVAGKVSTSMMWVDVNMVPVQSLEFRCTRVNKYTELNETMDFYWKYQHEGRRGSRTPPRVAESVHTPPYNARTTATVKSDSKFYSPSYSHTPAHHCTIQNHGGAIPSFCDCQMCCVTPMAAILDRQTVEWKKNNRCIGKDTRLCATAVVFVSGCQVLADLSLFSALVPLSAGRHGTRVSWTYVGW